MRTPASLHAQEAKDLDESDLAYLNKKKEEVSTSLSGVLFPVYRYHNTGVLEWQGSVTTEQVHLIELRALMNHVCLPLLLSRSLLHPTCRKRP
jgi:hypothetical protein